jgi:PKD repeat protein
MIPIVFFLLLLTTMALTKPAFGYATITSVNFYVPVEGKVKEEIPLQAGINTGNNLVEYVREVQATLILPSGVTVLSGDNPQYIGDMGPGPAYASCQWTIEFEEAGEYLLTVNASCINTQHIAQWVNASRTIKIYAPPYVEFECTPSPNAYINETVVFNATKSYAQGPDSQIVTYAWDFGDQTNATTNTSIIEHEYHEIGNHTVTLNVTDSQELSSMNTSEIAITLFGDLNFDGKVNIVDITIVAKAFNSKPGDLSWNLIADLNNDGVVNILDVTLVAVQYGKTT